VHDPLSVRLLKRLRHLASDLQRSARRRPRPLQHRLQGLSRDVLHHDARSPIDLGQLVDLADERMIERRRRPRFAMQSLERLGVRFQRLGQELDGDLAPQLGVVGEEHLAHAAFAEAGEDGVSGRGGHRCFTLASQPRVYAAN